jgi:alkylation response protein AidB-like acyl-CoA dehydrogenase
MNTEPRRLRSTVRSLIEDWRRSGRLQPVCDSWMRGFSVEFTKELAARRLIGLSWPQEFGGAGASNVARLVVTEELLRAGAPVAAHWIGDRQIGPAIIRHGSPALRKQILPGIVSGDFVFCLGLSESGAGSDLASVQTAARRVDGGWRISGRKMWTSHAHLATHMYLLARTEAQPVKHHGLSEFILDMSSPGINVTPIVDLAGEAHFNEVQLEDVFVPEDRLLGEEGRGWPQVIEQLSFERGGPERYLSTYPLLSALIQAASRQSTPPDPFLQRDVGRLTARLGALRHLAWDVATELDKGEPPVQQAMTLKYLGNEFEADVIESARTHLGADGGAASALFAQAQLASPGFGIRGGAAEVLLSTIARQEALT